MTKECAKQMAESMEKFFRIYDDYKHFGFNNRVHPERDMQVFMSAQMEAMNVIVSIPYGKGKEQHFVLCLQCTP